MSPQSKPSGLGELRAGRQFAASFGASALIQLTNVGTGILLARTLGPDGRGELAAVILWPTLLAVLGSLAVLQSMTHHAARREVPLGTLALTGSMLALAQSALLVGIGLILLPVVLDQYGSEAVTTGYINLAYVPLSLLALGLMGLLNGYGRHRSFQLIRVLVITAPALALAALALADRLEPRSAVLAYLGGNLLAFVVAAGLVVRAAHPGVARLDRTVAVALSSFGLRSQGSIAAATLNSRLDQLVVSVALSPALLGIYVVAVTLGSVTALIGISMALVALPAVSRLAAVAAHGEETRQTIRLFTSATFALGALASALLIVAAPWLVELFFGPGFEPAVGVSRIILVGTVAYGVNRTLEAILQGLGRPLEAARGEGIGLLAAIAALAILVPPLELDGAALASSVAYILAMGFMALRVRGAVGLPLRELLSPPAELAHPRALVGRLRSVPAPSDPSLPPDPALTDPRGGPGG